jgi:hypothetical protein
MNADERVLYLQAVWHTFQEKSGTRRDMSSAEYHLACKWMNPVFDKDGNVVRPPIPLAIVFRAFTDFKGKPRRLEALEGAVDEAQAYWVRAAGLL